MDKDQLLQLLKDNLSVVLDTQEVYNGGCDGSGSMYRTVTQVKIYFDGELVAES